MLSFEQSFYARLGLSLRAEMMRSGLNPTKLAHGMRVQRSGLDKKLRGERGITVQEFIRIVRFIGTSVDAVLMPEVHALAERARLAKGTSMTDERRIA